MHSTTPEVTQVRGAPKGEGPCRSCLFRWGLRDGGRFQFLDSAPFHRHKPYRRPSLIQHIRVAATCLLSHTVVLILSKSQESVRFDDGLTWI